MSDLFHDQVPDAYIEAVARVMVAAKWHSYQVLTKRSGRLRELLSTKLRFAANQPHIWWGVSVEDKKYGVPRISDLAKSPAAVRFLSVEPLLEDLGALDLQGIDWMIVGGESGAGARPMAKDWVAFLLSQCRRQKVKFFFKQWGGVRKSKTGRQLNGRTYDELPPRLPQPVSSAEECTRLAFAVEAGFPPTNFLPVLAIATS
jgi:protein gp37